MPFYYRAETEALIADLDIGDLKITWEWLHQPYVDAKRKWVGSHRQNDDGSHHIKIALLYCQRQRAR